MLDSAALQTLPSPGRTAFMIGTTVPTVIPSGDTQFNRQQDQTNASLVSLGGGTRRGNNYTLDGVPITDMRNRAVANPTIEGARRRQGAGAHLRRGDGPHRRRRVQHDAASRARTASTAPASIQTRPIWGQTNNYFSEIAKNARRAAIRSRRQTGKPNSPYYLGAAASADRS